MLAVSSKISAESVAVGEPFSYMAAATKASWIVFLLVMEDCGFFGVSSMR